MCGIVGYTGSRCASDILLDGLEKLEYRGYDSAGIAIMDSHIKLCKARGRLDNLRRRVKNTDVCGCIGIGHTRWATHGEPSDVNSHPHTSCDGKTVVVHNGIIENYEELRNELKSKGFDLKSQTDTEVIPNLINLYYKDSLTDAVKAAADRLCGSYAICVMDTREPGKIVALRKDSPLVIGIGRKENFVASDIPALLGHTDRIYLPDECEIVALDKDKIISSHKTNEEIYNNILKVTFEHDAAQKGIYEHFMIKEICEQSRAVRDTLAGRVTKDTDIRLDLPEAQSINKIYIIACGTAYNAGLVGKYAIETLARIPVETDISSEFRYRNPIIEKNNLLVVISQSGETADTLAALRLGKERGAKILAVTNVMGSTVSREADYVFYTKAGPEIAVASTKAYTTQLVAMYTLALFLAQSTNALPKKEIDNLKSDLLSMPSLIDEVMKSEEDIAALAADFIHEKDVFFLGRGLDYAVAMEGSLKLKEISYIHSEPYAGGELKHGPIALIEKGTMVIALSTSAYLESKMDANIKEVIARGARVIGICTAGIKHSGCTQIITLPKVNELFTPIVSVIPLQLLSYYVTVAKGLDADKPRNLAKSVTVE